MKKLKSLISVLLVLVMMYSSVACGGSSGESTGSDGNGNVSGDGSASGGLATRPTDDFVSYTVGISDYLGRFIQGLTPTESWAACDGVYDAVFKIDPSSKEVISACLEDWYYEDEVTLIAKLKETIYFSNGMHATAEDLLYSYTSIVDRGSSQMSSLGPIIWDECVVRDEYTVQFKFERPYRVFLNVMVYLLCKEWSLSLSDGWEDMAWYKPVGSGPYEVADFVSEDLIVLRARDNYWNADEVGPVYVDEWVLKFYKNYATMYMDLEVGNLAFAEAQAADYSRYVKSGTKGDSHDLFLLTTGSTMYYVFSFYDFPAWEDKRLREAVALGINWEELGMTAFQELYIPAESILPKDSPFFINPGKYEYNPEKAKALLAEAGYGPDNPLQVMTTVSDTPVYKNTVENMQYQFSQIGIDAEIVLLDAASTIATWNAGGGTDFMFWYRAQGSARSDPYDIMMGATRDTGTTCTRVYDPRFRELWFEMVYNTDPEIYAPAIKELQQYIFDEVIYIPYCEYTVSIGYNTDIFTESQLRRFVYGRNMYQLGRLGLLSSWE